MNITHEKPSTLSPSLGLFPVLQVSGIHSEALLPLPCTPCTPLGNAPGSALQPTGMLSKQSSYIVSSDVEQCRSSMGYTFQASLA